MGDRGLNVTSLSVGEVGRVMGGDWSLVRCLLLLIFLLRRASHLCRGTGLVESTLSSDWGGEM